MKSYQMHNHINTNITTMILVVILVPIHNYRNVNYNLQANRKEPTR